MMPDSCCSSPLQLAAIPPLANAAATALILVAFVLLVKFGWRWMSGPRARHMARLCNGPSSCGYCERKARQRVVNQYAADAREREKARRANA